MTSTDNASDDSADKLVRAMVDMWSESGERTVPMASLNPAQVVDAQLKENTGRHLLDSGSAHGRNWERNRENDPADDPAWSVGRGYVTHSLHDFMTRTFDRDETCVALESALYAYAYSDERKRDAWLRCMEDFAEMLVTGEVTLPMLRALGVSERVANRVVAFAREAEADRGSGRYGGEPDPVFTCNTYNHECHALSQVLQGTNFGGPYAEYAMIQVHGGADVRGGYTSPRVYTVWDSWVPTELWFRCDLCEWDEAESCLYGSDALGFYPEYDTDALTDDLRERDDNDYTDAEADEIAHDAMDEARDRDDDDGAVIHMTDGCCGNVGFM